MSLNKNTMNKQDTQKRILIATLLSFAFFIAYDFFYIQPQQKELQAKQKQEQKVTKNNNSTVKEVIKTNNQAPKTITKNNNAIVTQAINSTSVSDIITTVTTNNSIIKIDSLGRIAQVTLKEKQYIDKNGKAIDLFTKEQLKPLEVRFEDAKLNEEAFKTPISASAKVLNTTKKAQKLILTQKLSKTTLTKVLTFYPDGHYDIDISSSTNQNFFLTPGYRPNVLADMYADHGALVLKSDGTLEVLADEKVDKNEEFVGIHAVSEFDRYYTTVLYDFTKKLQVTVMANKEQSPEAFIHISNSISLHGYMGPKDHVMLKSLNPKLTDLIEYGWFTFIAKPMFLLLQFIYNIVGNWGWTIVFTTILIKLVLSPLAYKGMVSMNKLKELSPKVKALQEKYKDDKQKASVKMMELYKKEGANPMGGCLPIIMQIPVFFAIYRVLLNAIELKGSAWIFWIEDLAAMDPYFVLPVLMGITMFVQQKITPNQMQDEMQKKIFQFLPLIFTVMMAWFPAGLTLYWTVNNLFTVVQQYYINKMFDAKRLQKAVVQNNSKSAKGK